MTPVRSEQSRRSSGNRSRARWSSRARASSRASSVEPSPSPEVSPSPEPTVTPPTPAPEWTMSFASDLLGETSSSRLRARMVQGKAGKAVRFSQTVTGSLGDGPGMRSTRIYIEYWGSGFGPRARRGNAKFFALFLDTPAEGTSIKRQPRSPQSPVAQDGSAVYGFTGSYALTYGPAAAEASMPHDGNDHARLCLSGPAERPIYRTAMGLVESTG